MRNALLLTALFLVGCGNEPDDSIDPVPPPGAESTNRLMGEAERAAINAQKRMNQAPAPAPAPQGERK